MHYIILRQRKGRKCRAAPARTVARAVRSGGLVVDKIEGNHDVLKRFVMNFLTFGLAKS
jgi:hypothetical protein